MTDALRARGVDAHVAHAGVYVFGVRIVLGDGREAIWDADDTAGLEANVLQDGDLVGFVPVIEGSEDFDDTQTVAAIARTEYDRPVAQQRATVPAASNPLPPEGGVFRRFIGGFRDR
ncbi:MAG: hypothetical protein JWO63_403 [Frankiales bacterium]|nr:hypothetical protein [Frankiales bacterium]